MKHLFIALSFLCGISTSLWADRRGIPSFRNYSSTDYHAHNRNFDISTDDYGTVFVANFEGLIYFDGSSWRKIHTPGISRVTRIARDNNGRVWVGGYNVFGYLEADQNGCLSLHTIISDSQTSAFSEVDLISVKDQNVYVHTTDGKGYKVIDNNKIEELTSNIGNIFDATNDSINNLHLSDRLSLSYSRSQGILFNGDLAWAPLSEKDGLSSNAINYVTYNREQIVWAATDRGIFSVEVLSPYGQIGDSQGLKGEVNVIEENNHSIYVGTMEGLFKLENNRAVAVNGIEYACWQLHNISGNRLLAPTSDGLFVIDNGQTKQITVNNTLSAIETTEGDFIVGEMDGIYCIDTKGNRTQISTLEKISELTQQGNKLIAETLYGEQWEMLLNGSQAHCTKKQAESGLPKVSYTDKKGILWITDPDGRNVRIADASKGDNNLSVWTNAYGNYAVNTIFYSSDNKLWIGGDFGLRILDAEYIKTRTPLPTQPPLIRQVVVMGDSVLWGGYDPNGMKPVNNLTNIKLPSSCHEVEVFFSTKTNSITLPTTFRYRINGGRWSNWTNETSVKFNNLTWGSTTLELQALDLFNRISDTSKVEWHISFPFYLRWYSFILYLIIIIGIIREFFKMHTAKLARDKERLEAIVTERTSELKKSYEEQQKISATLSETLDDLKRTQNDLVRMERTATAGKLTQGLIDRILNPINYINNFSKLTSGLAKDLQEDVDNEKEAMSEDNYEDCLDLLDMMKQNLQKIEEHGTNTTRTLRAMEAMLNNHIGTLLPNDINAIVKQSVSVTNERLKQEQHNCPIDIKAIISEEPVIANIDAESLNRSLQSLLTNSIYAVRKKYNVAPFETDVYIQVTTDENNVFVHVHDNGIGIESTILEKVFDPFFTTKPTGEAAGVGLYLVRELIHDMKGNIKVESEKDLYCDFVITLPKENNPQ